MSNRKIEKGRGIFSIATPIYAHRFIKATWEKRMQMQDYERKGFFNFVYLTSCAHIEGLLANYLRALVELPLADIRYGSRFPIRKTMSEDGGTHQVAAEREQRMVQRILESLKEQLDRASFSQIEKFHTLIVGQSVRDIVGESLHEDIVGLVALRNVLAHGRNLYIVEEFPLIPVKQHDDFMEVKMDFPKRTVVMDHHPLERTFKSIKRAGLYHSGKQRDLLAHHVMELIYRDEVILHFHKSAKGIEEAYRKLAKDNKTTKFLFGPEMPDLSVTVRKGSDQHGA